MLHILFALVFTAAAVSATDLGELKKRMARRAPRIGELKADKSVGENNRGYLEILKPEKVDKKDRKIVEDENADRKTVYEAIARDENTTAQLVGKNRALMVYERAAPGIMVQKPDGTWTEKGEK
jgi:uncharacterized protein YdbL (DUF1318 family)